MDLNTFLQNSWEQYCEITPDAERIHRLLEGRGDTIVNDHIAYRTFDRPGISRFDLGKIFEGWGYTLNRDVMEFPEKKLLANYWIHSDPNLPKVFISELLLDQLSAPLREWACKITQSSLNRVRELGARALLQPIWEVPSFADYQKFYPESEYAAWTAAFGIRVNHFTVFVNSLKTFASLQDLNSFLKANGFALNDSGGVIKGSPSVWLEQSSTQAGRISWKFAGEASHSVMSCYYEFARRYSMGGGKGLFHGFVPSSADKIFESNFEKTPKN